MIDYRTLRHENMQELRDICGTVKCGDILTAVTEDHRFQTWSGSGDPKHHHYGTGGLLQHTLEVVRFALKSAKEADRNYERLGSPTRVNMKILLTGCVWHDYGKIWSYAQQHDGVWGYNGDHGLKIHHIAESALVFQRAADRYCREPEWVGKEIEEVTHLILSHHGRREWGSPVAPQTPEAWILHLSDCMSARLNDYQAYEKK